ncbi:HrpB1 family type III secretion system apparatus protein [Paraburkholderia sediminicola]|uniref:HrpB1 family type III secretion system apparatus protein n=1 Tax=Paraburkholderia metrosideri TaxID=580937 RepID=A0ABW9DQV3_9BURK
MNKQIDATNCSHELIGALTELLRMALVDQFPAPRVEIGDTEHLLEALHTMRPKLGELSLFDGFAYIVKGHWHDAIAVFEALVARSLCLPGSRAMLVYCLSASNNSDWRIVANQALDEPLSADASLLIRSITVLQDIRQARAEAAVSGKFVIPESLRPLPATSHAAPLDEVPLMNMEVPFNGYLRL